MNNNKSRRHDSDVGTIKQDCPSSPDVGPTDKSGNSAISPQRSQKFKNGGEDSRPLTTTEAECSAIKNEALRPSGKCSFPSAPGESDWRILAAVLRGIGENDHLEALLCSQMVLAYDLGMEFIRSARFTRQVEVLRTLRSKGEQKMIVEHVHVHNGGQAIVGSISPEAKTAGSSDKTTDEHQ
jgi:hypothetical protein